MTQSQVVTDRRAIRNRVNINSDKILKDVLPIQFKSSKFIANQAIYANRQWFIIHPIFIDHLYSLIDENYIKILSTNDKITFLKIAIKKKDLKIIGVVLAHIRKWEINSFLELEYFIHTTFSDEELDTIENTIPIWPWDFKFKSPEIDYDYESNYKNIIKLIDQIKPKNFKNKHNSLEEFVEIIKSSLKKKNTGPLDASELCSVTKKTTENNLNIKGSNMIPPSYLGPKIIDIYLKKQFEVYHNKKLKEMENKKTKSEVKVDQIINPYTQLGSQVIQQITKKVDDMYDSFFALKRNPPKHINKINPPQYLKNDRFVLVFQKNSFSVENDFDKNNNAIRYVKLSLGMSMKKNIIKKYLKIPKKDCFMKFKVPNNITEKIEEIELTPGKNMDDAYIIFKYNKKNPQPAPIIQDKDKNENENEEGNENMEDKKKKGNKYKRNYIDKKDIKNMSENDYRNMVKKIMSIDLGMVNIATCVCFDLDSPIIYDGSIVNYINRYYKKLISRKQAKLKTEGEIYTSKYLNNLWIRRDQKIRNQFERITNDIMKICSEKGITEIIIGYNTNWKTKVNMGRIMNEKFYKIPYSQFINMLFYKGKNKGINVKETTESYTSKCDALNLEKIEYHEKYSGERAPKKLKLKNETITIVKSRGLFQSARKVLINSDVNGAINIMRKGVMKRPELQKALEEIIKNIEVKKICNPKRKKFPN